MLTADSVIIPLMLPSEANISSLFRFQGANWWEGEVMGHNVRGIFPSNYVTELMQVRERKGGGRKKEREREEGDVEENGEERETKLS